MGMKIFAHRGFHDSSCAENTLSAFKCAAERGVDGIETDVRVSTEGLPILFHDRCLLDGRAVSSLTHRELSDAVGYDVPALAEALAQNWDVIWNLEIKAPEALHASIPVLKKFSGSRRLFISSFFHPLVEHAVEILKMDGGLLIAHAPVHISSLGAPTEHIRTIVWDFETATAELIAQARKIGFDSMLYGVLSRSDYNHSLEMGASAIITDWSEFTK